MTGVPKGWKNVIGSTVTDIIVDAELKHPRVVIGVQIRTKGEYRQIFAEGNELVFV